MATYPSYLEIGSKRVFAAAFEWPGWCRSARSEQDALAALTSYAPRYAIVAGLAGATFDPAGELEVLERVVGNATTDFGAPGAIAARDRTPTSAADADRTANLVQACWRALDDRVAIAPPTLRKGPRGGGRDRDAVVEHVLAAENAYARSLGVRLPQPTIADAAGIAGMREAIRAALVSRASGDDAPRWPPAYAARRIAWHVLDHAWEIEDRTEA